MKSTNLSPTSIPPTAHLVSRTAFNIQISLSCPRRLLLRLHPRHLHRLRLRDTFPSRSHTLPSRSRISGRREPTITLPALLLEYEAYPLVTTPPSVPAPTPSAPTSTLCATAIPKADLSPAPTPRSLPVYQTRHCPPPRLLRCPRSGWCIERGAE